LGYSLTVALVTQVNKALNRPDSSLFCRDTGLIWGRSIFFPVYFSTSFKNKNIYLKKSAVEAAESNRLSSRCVEIHLRRIHFKRCHSEDWVFCIRYFSKTKHKPTKTITQRCFSCQSKSVCQKSVRSCKK